MENVARPMNIAAQEAYVLTLMGVSIFFYLLFVSYVNLLLW